MIWAIKGGERILATPKQVANCPLCSEEVISKCGSIKIWHWSHKADADCDNWGEGETDWHINWKNEFPKEMQEIVIRKYISSASGDSGGDEMHRADIQLSSGKVIELQNSSISAEDIIDREQFYGNMIWLLNGYVLWEGLNIRPKENKLFTFRWKHPAKSWWSAKMPIYIDMGNHILHIKKIYPNMPCGGYGLFIEREEFLKQQR
jgi:competence CoiA-like predicted nuclease